MSSKHGTALVSIQPHDGEKPLQDRRALIIIEGTPRSCHPNPTIICCPEPPIPHTDRFSPLVSNCEISSPIPHVSVQESFVFSGPKPTRHFKKASHLFGSKTTGCPNGYLSLIRYIRTQLEVSMVPSAHPPIGRKVKSCIWWGLLKSLFQTARYLIL